MPMTLNARTAEAVETVQQTIRNLADEMEAAAPQYKSILKPGLDGLIKQVATLTAAQKADLKTLVEAYNTQLLSLKLTMPV